jgi:hypothetical protein
MSTEVNSVSTSLLDAAPQPTPAATEGGSLLGSAGSGNTTDQPASKPGETPADKPADPSVQAKADTPADKKPVGAPEKYTDFKLPEGVALNPEMASEFSATAKELNLSQEAAQKLVDVQSKFVKAQVEAQQAQFKQTVQELKSETIKVLGADYEKQLGIAAKAIERFGTPELRTLLNETGLGNHKELVQMFMKVGKAISEDSFVEGNRVSGSRSAAAVLYPSEKQ